MATIWSSGPDATTPPADVDYGGEAFSTPRVLIAIVAGCLALGALGLALVGALGWNRFDHHISPLVYVAVLGTVSAVTAMRWDRARRDPTAYVVVGLLATAVYLEVAYGDLTDWDRIVPDREAVSGWLGRNHRALSAGLAVVAVVVGVRSRRVAGQGSGRRS